MPPMQRQSGSATPSFSPLKIHNIEDGETVHQRCVLLIGQCQAFGSGDDFLSVKVVDGFGAFFPVQNWPVSDGHWRALVLLSSGTNHVTIEQYHNNHATESLRLSLTYVPLLQVPPLHLAIMVARDSPLLIDCPPVKRGGLSSAHAGLDAAIAKFRMTAYMWQALTAEDMRSKGLGRRSFRFEEEWSMDTTTADAMHMGYEPDSTSAMRATAKIHVIRSDKTVAELHASDVAQQNPAGRRRDDLHKYFEEALLKANGGIFVSNARSVVAGLILDSHYSVQQDMILAHAALGCHKENGLSLGVFGSHLTYSWPRFLEEVPACLLDIANPGDTVGNDNGECDTAWEACSIGQGAFLHEVGHAFGAPHTSGIMARGYAQDWPKNFLARTGYCAKTQEAGTTVNNETSNDARWDLKDALMFKVSPHFKLPGDMMVSQVSASTHPSVRAVFAEADPEAGLDGILLECPVGIARVQFNGSTEHTPTVANPANDMDYSVSELEDRFDRSKPLKLSVLGMNGRQCMVNVWKLLASTTFVRIPGSSIVLSKRSVKSAALDEPQEESTHRHGNQQFWQWAMLLNEKGADGKLHRATAIDLRVGATMDGAVVHYADGHHTNCGPRVRQGGSPHHFGGHASQKKDLPVDANIVKIELNRRSSGWGSLNGIRLTLSNGTSWGELHAGRADEVVTLEPAIGEKIVGFYGQSERSSGFCYEWGVLLAPEDVVLPEKTYEMAELQNTDGGLEEEVGQVDDEEWDEYCEDEDEDENMEDDEEHESPNTL